MRTLLLFRGSAGVGKSTYIENHGLKPYTLSADEIRLLCQSPVLQPDGSLGISLTNEKTVWSILFKLLELRMSKGEFTVIDATNSKTSELKKYKELADDYRYRIFCIDMTDVPIEEVKRRNSLRDPLKRVADEVIDKMYSRFATQKVPSGITVIKPNELHKIKYPTQDVSEYKRIHHIGDIHGCNTVLQEYLIGGLKDDELYIFTGDYIDRGLENVDVMNFLFEIYQKPNVILLEGNHERHLWNWANNNIARSKEFSLITQPQLDNAKISKKETRCLYRKLRQCFLYSYYDKTVLVTHAGISTLPENMVFMSTYSMIYGVGGYNDIRECDETFNSTTENNVYQIHGHRNTEKMDVKVNESCFNLECGVEFGGYLRCVTLTKENGFETHELKNNVFKEIEVVESDTNLIDSPISDIIISLRNNRYIEEKKFGNISSFNFTRNAFYNREWNATTIKARGLYLDTTVGKVFARAYDKFFNINEKHETKLDSLSNTLKFPVTAYVKENGFLGIIAYDPYTDGLFTTTKSDPTGLYADYLRNNLNKMYTEDTLNKIKLFCKENDVSIVVECVDMENDPHIIKYDSNRIILLDIVKNEMVFSKYSYDDLCRIASELGLTVKRKAYEIFSWQEFYAWREEILAEDYLYDGKEIEGFVIEDADGFMIKQKLSYYSFWKHMRKVAHEAIKFGYISRTGTLLTPLANSFYDWVRKLHDVEDLDSIPRDICALRDMYYKEIEGRK